MHSAAKNTAAYAVKRKDLLFDFLLFLFSLFFVPERGKSNDLLFFVAFAFLASEFKRAPPYRA